ncbi:MAG: hypothetical protein ACI351_02140 [Candidatus Avelusimicrobium sp.]|uniref:hypothetical protein n=1 Tax=Candidatus Avelusimicrobium sp. TaxID=3048833 RepID=UPI003F11ACDC
MKLTWSGIKNEYRRLLDFSGRRSARYAAWEKLAEQGNEEARYRLLMLYSEKQKEFYPLAFKWTLRVAKESANCAVLLQAAQMLEAGHGTVQDDSQALVWFERALSLHILQGKNSSLSAERLNYIQEHIQSLRAKLGRE